MYELSFLTLAPGAAQPFRAEMRAMMSADGERASPWSGLDLPLPVGTWIATGGGSATALQLFRWDNFAHRDRSLPRLWQSDEWQDRMLGGKPLVKTSEHWIVQPTPHGRSNPEGPAGGVHEFRVQNVLNGTAAHASEGFWTITAPAVAAAGGFVLGQFEIVIGPGRPTFVTILAWPNREALHQGWFALDRSAEIRAQRQAEIARFGRPLFEPPEQFVAEPMEWNRPPANLEFAA